ncbi:MAG: NAD(P)H-dependent oxidoreductase [Verrucomicrobiia bacterium]
MKTLLAIHSSGRVTRSITRRLTARFIQTWLGHNPDSRVVERDVTTEPPPVVNEAWITAAFAGLPAQETPEELRLSETLIQELFQADLIVIGAPIYNFGMPAQLKAYIDQVVRVGRTFAFEPGNPEPYRPLVPYKPVVVITSAGDGDIHPGGPLAHMNHLEPHLTTALEFIGLTDLHFIRAGYDEYQDDRSKRSLAGAEHAVDEWFQQTNSP